MSKSIRPYFWSAIQISTFVILISLICIAYFKSSKQPSETKQSTGIIDQNYKLPESLFSEESYSRKYVATDSKDEHDEKIRQNDAYIKTSFDLIQDIHHAVKNLQTEEDFIFETKAKLETGKISSSDSIRKDILDRIKFVNKKLILLKDKLENLDNSYRYEIQPFIDSLKNDIVSKTEEINKLKNEIIVLNNNINGLKNNITGLNNNITGLNKTIEIFKENTGSLENTIDSLENTINTTFVVSGNIKKLKTANIIKIKRRLGNLYLRKHIEMSKDFNKSGFEVENKSKTEFKVDQKIKQLIPYRNKSYYKITQNSEKYILTIKDPEHFWLNPYLVIITK